MRLYNRCDGVDGHYCVGRFNEDGKFHEFWNEQSQKFCSAGSVFVSEKLATAKLLKLCKEKHNANNS